ncbi:UbiD family decarboxylase [Phlyctema vagabunda]|uniref:UbiD family decarboxylase n=1 Tax=Phlyctema vagabunda TaxID=108571 RepID=A0ABR4PIY1_9HELO
MLKSAAAAAKAVIEGENTNFDTQECLHMQADILSSSPVQSPERAVASSKVSKSPISAAGTASSLPQNDILASRASNPPHHGHPHTLTTPSVLRVTAGAAAASCLQNIANDPVGRRRQYTRYGSELEAILNTNQPFDGLPRPFNTPANLQELRGTIPAAVPAMYTQTQRDSCSPTQENTPSVYARFESNLGFIEPEASLPDAFSTDPRHLLDDPIKALGVDITRTQHASVFTESTARTYKEQDIGHINFEVLSHNGTQGSIGEAESQELISQDTSYVPNSKEAIEQDVSQHDPETPAPPVNPFMRKGSVMQAHELFGATQPSSAAARFASPTSSRPSPDVFNAMQSPSGLRSSPLVRRSDTAPVTSPLHSSVRNLLAQPRHNSTTPDLHPFTAVPTTAGTISSRLHRQESPAEVHIEYISMKESQERRANLISSLEPSEDDESDIDSGPRRRLLRKKRELHIQKELAAVELTRPSRMVSSSREVEVPSTGRRRRSLQEEYIAQCNGSDARDTQEDDVIVVDSQGQAQTGVDGEELLENVPSSLPDDDLNGPPQSQQSQHLPPHAARPGNTDPVPELDSNSNTRDATSEPPRSPEQHSTLPLQELDGNGASSRCSLPQKTHLLSDTGDSTVPETSSPARLRPMGEIASLSLSAPADYEIYQNIPGLTQDHDYNRLMGSSPPVETDLIERERSSRSEKGGAPKSSEIPNAESRRSGSSSVVSNREIELHETVITANKNEPCSSIQKQQTSPTKQDRTLDEISRQASPSSKIDPTGDSSHESPRKGRRRVEVEAKIAMEVQERAKERRESKIAFRKAQIQAGTQYEPDDSDNDELVQAALKMFKYEIDSVAKPANSTRVALAESSPDPLTHAEELETTPSKKTDGTLEAPNDEIPQSGRAGLRTRDELKGPSRALRRSDPVPNTPASKKTYTGRKGRAKVKTSSSLRTQSQRGDTHETRPSTHLRRTSSTPDSPQTSPLSSVPTSVDEDRPLHYPERYATPRSAKKKSLRQLSAKKSNRRKSTLVVLHSDEDEDEDEVMPSKTTARTAKQRTEPASSSTKPPDRNEIMATPIIDALPRKKKADGDLFANMAFAVSYVENEPEREAVIDLILKQGGTLLEEGFDDLLEDHKTELVVSKAAQKLGFVALIADEHTRRAKYMQALAMGLPCLSGRWILACHNRNEVVNWAPYLLCAGISSFMGDTVRSRTLQNYSASTARFIKTFNSREKLLGDQSVMLLAGTGKKKEKRKPYIFLARVLAPAKFCLVSDYSHAREKLLQAEVSGESWDCLYVNNNEEAATQAVFSSSGTKQSRKRKRATAEEDVRAPKKIRVISDEVVVQSLISGQLLEEE